MLEFLFVLGAFAAIQDNICIIQSELRAIVYNLIFHHACFAFLIRLFAEYYSRRGIPLQMQNKKNVKKKKKKRLTVLT